MFSRNPDRCAKCKSPIGTASNWRRPATNSNWREPALCKKCESPAIELILATYIKPSSNLAPFIKTLYKERGCNLTAHCLGAFDCLGGFDCFDGNFNPSYTRVAAGVLHKNAVPEQLRPNFEFVAYGFTINGEQMMLAGNNCDAVILAAAEGLAIRTLDVGNHACSTDTLLKLPNLVDFSTKNKSISGDFSGLKLRALRLFRCQIEGDSGLKLPPTLETLWLDGVHGIDPEVLRDLPRLTEIRTFDSLSNLDYWNPKECMPALTFQVAGGYTPKGFADMAASTIVTQFLSVTELKDASSVSKAWSCMLAPAIRIRTKSLLTVNFTRCDKDKHYEIDPFAEYRKKISCRFKVQPHIASLLYAAVTSSDVEVVCDSETPQLTHLALTHQDQPFNLSTVKTLVLGPDATLGPCEMDIGAVASMPKLERLIIDPVLPLRNGSIDGFTALRTLQVVRGPLYHTP